MPTDAAMLAQLQTLWQAAPAVGPSRATTAEAKAGLPAEPPAGYLDRLPAGDQAAGDLDSFDWFELIGDAEREFLLTRHRHPERCGFCGGHFKHSSNCVALCEEWAIKMPFGKHKGLRVADVPHDYLRWLLGNAKEMEGDLRQEIEWTLATCE